MKITIDLEVKDLIELSKINKLEIKPLKVNDETFDDLNKKLTKIRDNIFANIEKYTMDNTHHDGVGK